jgi:VIT1/CCC1 family predicted Fe2+/Mn2+ transporter
MAVSNFLGTRAQQELLDNTRRQEKILIDNNPEQQKEELKKLFRDKGFRLEMVEDIANSIARDKKLWLDTILREKHDMPLRGSNPLRAGFSTLMAFVVAGAIPILPFLVLLVTQKESTEIFVWSAAAAAFTFLIIGALKSVITGSLWLRSSLETLFIGGIAASLAYLIGRLLKDIATSL